MDYIFYPRGVCSREVHFTLDGNVVKNVSFVGGCNGNLKAISKLIEGKTVEELESILSGNTCGYRSTSCADQLTIGLRAALDGKLSPVG